MIFLAVTAIIGGTAIAAHAGQGGKYWNSGYPNAWGGGPDVNWYGGATANDDWTFHAGGSGGLFTLIESTPGSSTFGPCMGDANNDQFNARVQVISGCSQS